MAVVFSEIKFT